LERHQIIAVKQKNNILDLVHTASWYTDRHKPMLFLQVIWCKFGVACLNYCAKSLVDNNYKKGQNMPEIGLMQTHHPI